MDKRCDCAKTRAIKHRPCELGHGDSGSKGIGEKGGVQEAEQEGE
ncbi:hypothetical protein GCM10009621_06950 [Corynebacterium felinum]